MLPQGHKDEKSGWKLGSGLVKRGLVKRPQMFVFCIVLVPMFKKASSKAPKNHLVVLSPSIVVHP
jgi:hypothetical protein